MMDNHSLSLIFWWWLCAGIIIFSKSDYILHLYHTKRMLKCHKRTLNIVYGLQEGLTIQDCCKVRNSAKGGLLMTQSQTPTKNAVVTFCGFRILSSICVLVFFFYSMVGGTESFLGVEPRKYPLTI